MLDVFAEKNQLFAATALGLCIFKEEKNKKWNKPPPVYFSSVSNNGLEISERNNLSFPYDAMHLIVSFVAPTFENPDQVTYRYIISENGNGEWTETMNSKIEFGVLTPGNYTFLLAAKKVNSGWSSPIKLQFSVIPPFWRTTLFIWLASIVVTGMIALFIFALYRRKTRKRIAALENRESWLS